MEAHSVPQAWAYSLGPLSRIPPGEGKTFMVAARLVAVFRMRGGRPVGNAYAALKAYPVEINGRGDVQLYLEER